MVYHDTDADDMIDLRGEYNFTYAKKLCGA